ncbi:MAG: bacterial Ig-like domain-containing protein [Eubacteriales bacterium]|nr:bacterial Ig-like domain-containing protein [Eubacteriales bacterium]
MRKRNLKIKQVFAGLCCAALVGGMLPLLPAQAVLVRTNDEYRNNTSLRPIAEMFYMDKILNWQPGVNADDALNKGSVPLAPRYQGHLINPKASKEGKIQMLSLMNSKDVMSASTNNDSFDAYAFDYWQYLDSAIFWDGPVPTADMIDAAHRNGVPIYGTLFFNWTSWETSGEDNSVFAEFIKSEQRDGVKVFPVAEKLVDIALYYGFDGYFINQETTGWATEGKAEDMRDFMLYAKSLAKARGANLRFSWYDAMTNKGHRDHQNAVNSANDIFAKPVDRYGLQQTAAADEFFMNFNWSDWGNAGTAKHMTKIGRSPFDAHAGFELQQKSYKTGIDFPGLLGKDEKMQVSIGLFTPDSIRGLAADPEDYHEQENYFWTGRSGDPSKEQLNGSGWTGMSRFVGDKTAITSLPFSTTFNTGHGKQWFYEGEVIKDSEWSARGVSSIMPTWRWWIKPSASAATLKAKYDFDDAYNSGSSVKIYGSATAANPTDVMLFSTKLELTAQSKLKVAYKGGSDGTKLILATNEEYTEFTELPLTASDGEWKEQEIDVSALAGQTVYAIGVREGGEKNDYSLNLGQLSLYDTDAEPQAPSAVQVEQQIVRNAMDAEARISWQAVAGADFYEVYETNGNDVKLINATSSDHFYASHITREAGDQGTMENLYVVAVGKNGERSKASPVIFDWGMEVDSTGIPEKASPNICLNAKIIDVSGENASEPAKNALNGTINGNTDKWCALSSVGYLQIDVGAPKTVRRWLVAHAGAGGEGAIQNTPDFALEYFDEEKQQWIEAKKITNNTENVTDVILDKPVTAQKFKLRIDRADRSPWTAIRIYEWQMFEQDDNRLTKHIPMQFAKAELQDAKEHSYKLSFTNGPAKAELKVATDKEMQQVIKTVTLDEKGTAEIPDVKLEEPSGTLFYTTKSANKETSLTMCLPYASQAATQIRELELTMPPTKTKYMLGEALNTEGGVVTVTYNDGEQKQIALDDQSIEIKGYDAELDEPQLLRVYYQGIMVDYLDVEVFRYKGLSHLEIKQLPKSEYAFGEGLSLQGGVLHVRYMDDTEEDISFLDEGVEVSGYLPETAGEQYLSVSFKDKTIPWTVVVAEQVHYEKLQAAVTAAQAVKLTARYTNATAAEKAAFDQALAQAELILAAQEADQKTVDLAQSELEDKTAKLTGQELPPFKPTWHGSGKQYWYEYERGKWYANGWKTIGSQQYHFKADGYLSVNTWVEDTYYVDRNGHKLRSTFTPDGFRVDRDGRWAKGGWKQDRHGWWYGFTDGYFYANSWQLINRKWYHFDQQGYLETNRWIGGRYYVDHNGVMLTSTWTPDGYYVDGEGKWVESRGRKPQKR